MDILALLSQATVKDLNGVELGDVMGIHFVAGKMTISINLNLGDDDEEDDPYDGAKDDIPEDDASKIEFPRLINAGETMSMSSG